MQFSLDPISNKVNIEFKWKQMGDSKRQMSQNNKNADLPFATTTLTKMKTIFQSVETTQTVTNSFSAFKKTDSNIFLTKQLLHIGKLRQTQ